MILNTLVAKKVLFWFRVWIVILGVFIFTYTKSEHLLFFFSNNMISLTVYDAWSPDYPPNLRCDTELSVNVSDWLTNVFIGHEEKQVNALLNEGRLYCLLGQAKNAGIHWENAFYLMPSNPLVYYYYLTGVSASLPLYTGVNLIADNEMLESLSNYGLKRGRLLLDKGEVGLAKEWLTWAMGIHTDRRIPYALAGAYLRSEDTASAILTWNTYASFLKESDPDYWWSNAQVAELENDWARAVYFYRQGERIIPNVELFWFFIREGQALIKLHDWEKADAAFRSAIDIDINHPDAYIGLGDIYSIQNKYNDAIVWYEKAINMDPDNVKAGFMLGQAYYELGNYTLAEKYLSRVFILNPSNLKARYLLAMALYQLERKSEALQKMVDLLDSMQQPPLDWYLILIKWYEELELYEEASNVYNDALFMYPNNSQLQELSNGFP